MAEARTEAKRAIAELRDLVPRASTRPPHRPGLDAALSSLAGASPVPVDTRRRARRPPAGGDRGGGLLRRRGGARRTSPSTRGADARCACTSAARRRAARRRPDDGAGGADPAGAGLTGLRNRVAALDGKLDRQSARGDHDPRGAPMRVVIAEDSPCCAKAHASLARPRHARWSPRSTTAPRWSTRSSSTGPTSRSSTCGCRRLHRRGPACGDRAAPAVPGTPVLVLSQYVEERYAAELLAGASGGRRLPPQGSRRRCPDFRRRRCGGWPPADGDRPRGRRPAARRAATTAARSPSSPRASARCSALMAEGAPTRHRQRLGDVSRRGREAHHADLLEARADALGRGPPSGPRRARIPRSVD